MRIICLNCGNIHADPGGKLVGYSCQNCGSTYLQRVPDQENRENDSVVGMIAGAAVGGSLFGPGGALIGCILGGLLGASRKQTPQR